MLCGLQCLTPDVRIILSLPYLWFELEVSSVMLQLILLTELLIAKQTALIKVLGCENKLEIVFYKNMKPLHVIES